MHPLPHLAACVALTAACSAVPAAGAPQDPGLAGAPPPVPCNLAGAPSRVQIFGGIKRPGALVYAPGLTVFGAIARAGGLEESAVARQVRIVRCGRAIGPFVAPAAPGARTDIPLERGDVLDIPVEVF